MYHTAVRKQWGQNIRAALKSRSKTQAWLASELTIEENNLCAILNGYHTASLNIYISISKILEAHPSEIFNIPLTLKFLAIQQNNNSNGSGNSSKTPNNNSKNCDSRSNNSCIPSNEYCGNASHPSGDSNDLNICSENRYSNSNTLNIYSGECDNHSENSSTHSIRYYIFSNQFHILSKTLNFKP
jgi:DNA-binding XRE family transcriptional regulator